MNSGLMAALVGNRLSLNFSLAEKIFPTHKKNLGPGILILRNSGIHWNFDHL